MTPEPSSSGLSGAELPSTNPATRSGAGVIWGSGINRRRLTRSLCHEADSSLSDSDTDDMAPRSPLVSDRPNHLCTGHPVASSGKIMTIFIGSGNRNCR